MRTVTSFTSDKILALIATLIPKSLIDAKGDLIAGSASDTAVRLAVGANGYVLTADSTVEAGMKWAAAAGFNKYGTLASFGAGSTVIPAGERWYASDVNRIYIGNGSTTITTFTSTFNYFGRVSDLTYAVNTVATSGAAQTLTTAYAAHSVTMSANCTFTFSAPTAGHTFLLRLAGAFTPTFPASVDWDGGVAPTYTSPALYSFTTLDGGTTWFGAQVGRSFA